MGRRAVVDYYASRARRSTYLLTGAKMIRVYCGAGHELAAEPIDSWAGSRAEDIAGRPADCARCKETLED